MRGCGALEAWGWPSSLVALAVRDCGTLETWRLAFLVCVLGGQGAVGGLFGGLAFLPPPLVTQRGEFAGLFGGWRRQPLSCVTWEPGALAGVYAPRSGVPVRAWPSPSVVV